MEKNAWYVCGQVAKRIDDAPILKDYIKSKVSEPPEKLFFFSSSHLDRYRSASGRNKMEFPGAVYFRNIESFMEDNYIRGELFVEFCRDAAAYRRPPISVLAVLTIAGWDQRQKEFRNLYQAQTIGDISWMPIRRNRHARHRMTPAKMFEGLV